MLLSSAKCSECVNENDYHLQYAGTIIAYILQCINTLQYGKHGSVNPLTSMGLPVNLLTHLCAEQQRVRHCLLGKVIVAFVQQIPACKHHAS